MKQQLLADIELDVQELKCLMKSFSEDPKPMLAELVKRNVSQMQGRLEQLLEGLEADCAEGSVKGIAEATDRPMKEPVFIVESPRVEDDDREESQADQEELASENVSEVTFEKVEEWKTVETVTEAEDESKEADETDEEMEAVSDEELEDDDEEDTIEDEEEECNSSAVLGERIRVVGGLRQAISLNDSFRFSRELFGGDMSLMNRTLEQLSVMSSYKNALAFLASKFMLDEENDAHVDFLDLLKKYFSQTA